MASSQEKEEKARFFEHLYRLDDLVSDDESHDEASDTSHDQHTARPVKFREQSRHTDEPYSGTRSRNILQAHAKKRLHEEPSQPAPIVIEDEGDGDNRESRNLSPARKKKTRFEVKTKNATKPTNLPVKAEKRNSTNILNLKQRKRQVPKSMKLTAVPIEQQFFREFIFYFVPNDDDHPVRRIRMYKSVLLGAEWVHEWYDDVTHIIVDNSYTMSEVAASFPSGKVPECPAIVLEEWLVHSFSLKQPQDVNRKKFLVPGFESLQHDRIQGHTANTALSRIKTPMRPKSQLRRGDITPSKSPLVGEQKAHKVSTISDDQLGVTIQTVKDLDYLSMDPSFDTANEAPHREGQDLAFAILRQDDEMQKQSAGFQCMVKHGSDADGMNPNGRTIENLQKLATFYDRKGDHWRMTAFRKAIGALKSENELVRTKEQAMSLNAVGESIAGMIEEFVSKDRIRRLDEAQKDPRDQTLELFMGIYGVGAQTAASWYSQGHRTLKDIRRKVNLTPCQLVGLDHYDDLQRRIPRDEVAQHASIVRKALRGADEGLQMIVGGSFRRGKADCGDIDCIITKEGANILQIRTLMMNTVIPELTEQGFLKVALATGTGDDATKWHGCSALPGTDIWRRIDLLFVPWAELGAALIYFTGDDIFNRSIRLLASKKNMRLNQHGLYKDVLRGRGRQRITKGRLVEGQDEKRIFDILGVPFWRPEDRQIG
ncbi:uncharacterized protein PV06_02124 [Exophiala oligosperma]|uniref:DNA-directed DNA polymerase n=1 Tax=Exophiala oligosperma TaxID=215243 RepID=A0A0D2DTK5_9EURO|nr:uncharacterized protein PV06_02124 [Exophiala oligosperma]KIW46453.1 hypothetical protein PV06_02124 [Exophiala oligosperma]